MSIITYLLYCVGAIFKIYSGGDSNGAYKEAGIGLFIIIVVGGIYVLLVYILRNHFILHNNKRQFSTTKVLIYSFLIELGIVGIFCGIVMLVELLI